MCVQYCKLKANTHTYTYNRVLWELASAVSFGGQSLLGHCRCQHKTFSRAQTIQIRKCVCTLDVNHSLAGSLAHDPFNGITRRYDDVNVMHRASQQADVAFATLFGFFFSTVKTPKKKRYKIVFLIILDILLTLLFNLSI